MPVTNRLLPATSYAFAPANRSIDFSGVPGFDPRRLLAVINKVGEETIYVAGEPELAFTISGAVLIFAFDTTAMSATDELFVLYEPDGPALANDAATASAQAAIGAQIAALLAQVGTAPVVVADASGAIGAGSVVSAAAANPQRQFLELSNTGANPLAYRWGDDPSAVVGHPLAPGETRTFAVRCPTAQLRLYSEAGTTFFLTAG